MDDKTNSGADRQDDQREKVVTEEVRISGESVTAKLRELLREGNVRRIIVKNDGGQTLVKVPLTVGVVGALLLPVWAGVGVVVALVAGLNLSVQRGEGVKLAEANTAAPDSKAPSNPATDTPPNTSSSAERLG